MEKAPVALVDSSVLQKRRMRHTRIGGLGLALIVPVVQSYWGVENAIHEILEWLGYFLLILCVLGRTWCSAYIGGRKNSRLVAIGPFSVVRNPLYVFSFLGVTGLGLLTGSISIAILCQVLFVLYYRDVVTREESVLLAAFGDTYLQYKVRVPRWFPRVRLWSEPNEVAVHPRFLYITLRDIGWMLVLFPVIEGIDYLQASGALPVLLRLP